MYSIHDTSHFFGASNKNKWYIDSGATKHMTLHGELIDSLKSNFEQITAANGDDIAVKGTEVAKVSFKEGDIQSKRLIHVPGLAVNLLSVSRIAQSGNTVVFNSYWLLDLQRVFFCKATNGVYEINVDNERCMLAKFEDAYTWHRRLEHASYPVMKKMRAGAGVNFAESASEIANCEICPMGKQMKKPFNANETESSELLNIVHSD